MHRLGRGYTRTSVVIVRTCRMTYKFAAPPESGYALPCRMCPVRLRKQVPCKARSAIAGWECGHTARIGGKHGYHHASREGYSRAFVRAYAFRPERARARALALLAGTTGLPVLSNGNSNSDSPPKRWRSGLSGPLLLLRALRLASNCATITRTLARRPEHCRRYRWRN